MTAKDQTKADADAQAKADADAQAKADAEAKAKADADAAAQPAPALLESVAGVLRPYRAPITPATPQPVQNERGTWVNQIGGDTK